MEKLITNAKSQFQKFGQVRITIYPNRSVNDCYDIVEERLEDAIEIISHLYQSQNDDLSVLHANAM
jgi:hypothetical protein